MRLLFILIVLGAAGYLGYTHKDELLAKVSEIQQSRSGSAEPAKEDGERPAVAPASNAPSAPLAPGEKRLAPPGVFYVTTRVAIQQDSGIKALNAGEQVKLMYHNNDGTARVTAGKYDFVVKESLLTNDLDVAQRLAAAAPTP